MMAFWLLLYLILMPTVLSFIHKDFILSSNLAASFNDAKMFCMQDFNGSIATVNTSLQLKKVKAKILQRHISKFSLKCTYSSKMPINL